MKVEQFIGLIMIVLGIILLLFGVFAMFYQGRAYWGNGVIVGYEYPYAKYMFPCLIAGLVFFVFGVILFSVAIRRRQKLEEGSSA